MKTFSILLLVLFSLLLKAQTLEFEVSEINANSLSFKIEDNSLQNVIVHCCKTADFLSETRLTQGLTVEGLEESTCYYVKISGNRNGKYQESPPKLYTTASKSTGQIIVYFNNPVDNSASAIADAQYISAFEDTLVAYINRVQYTIDIANYNTGSLAIVNAINAAEARGIVVRYVGASTEITNNDEIDNLSPTIGKILRPSDGEVMHNKFMIIDVAFSNLAKVITGSTNHTDNSMHNDPNNLVVIQDQSLANAYTIEFEEMFGSTTNLPNPGNAKFGNAKTDNTPHNFNIGGIPVELYFSPSDGTTAKIEQALLSAGSDLQFATLTFTNNDLGDAVIAAHNQGAIVKGIMENIYYFGSEYNGLLSAGIDVLSHFDEPWFFHHKYAVIDATNTSSDPIVVTGSHNWTNSAENDYDENTLIIHDAAIANMYFEEFTQRYNDMTLGTSVITDKQSNCKLYPNPTSGHFTIEYNDIISHVTIADCSGRIVHISIPEKSRFISINLNHLPSGYYNVKIESEGKTEQKKLLITN